MSGRDDEYPEPEAPRPRRARSTSRAQRRSRARGRGIQFDRRLLLLALAAVVLIVVLIFAVRQCQRDQLVNSYKGYVSDVTEIVGESTTQGQTLRTILNNEEGKAPAMLRQDIRQITDAAEATRANAEDLDPPGALDAAHRSLLVSLGFRAGGLRRLADDLQSLLQNNDDAVAANGLAAAMQRFLASDILYEDSFLAPAKTALEDDDIVGVELPEGDDRTRFLPGNTAALASANGATTLLPNLRRTGGGSGGQNTTDPGGNLKGVQLVSVEALPSGTRLVPGQEIAVTASSELRWRVTIENGGDFDETAVKVVGTLEFSGADEPEVRENTIAEIRSGETASVELAGPSQPRFETATFTVKAGPVPGETRTENNEGHLPGQVQLRLTVSDVPAWYLAVAAIPGVVALGLAVWALVVLRAQGRAQESRLAEGTQADLADLRRRHEDVTERLAALGGDVARLGADADARLRASVRFQGLVRYDAYTDMGGEQSWSIALLNEDRTGTVITSLHARDHARVYLKQVIEGQPEQRLSPEEEQAVARALGDDG